MTWISLLALGFTSLLPLVNPIGTSLIINPFLAQTTPAERRRHSFLIVFYSWALGIFTLVVGNWCLDFMGVSIPTTQLAGGLLISRMGLDLLNNKTDPDDKSVSGGVSKESLFYPLAFPLTVGPGCISVLITLSAHAHTASIEQTTTHMLALAAGFTGVMVITYFCLLYSDVLIRRIGSQGSLVLNRLMAFLVFCVGLQLAANGFKNSFPELFK